LPGWFSRIGVEAVREVGVRYVGLDVHRDFCEVAILEQGAFAACGRVNTTPEALAVFAASLTGDDLVALEVTGNAWEIARILQQHAGRVLVVNPSETGIAQARAKTDRLDARALARLLAMGELDAVWRTQVLRRRLARRRQLVQTRASTKNEIHAVLMRRLKGRPPASDLFGQKGRAWLEGLEFPLQEQETVDAGLRLIDFVDSEIAQVERLIAGQALEWPELRRLMTVPGVNLTTFLGAIGDIRRFRGARQLTAYLGLDLRVRQSGTGPTRHGKISKQGSAPVRKALVEAAWSAVRNPGPMRALYQRVRARRGHQIAIVASARKLAGLIWCLLTREQDYAYGRPSLTAVKLRRLEITAGAPRWQKRTGTWAANHALANAERQLAEQAEAAYKQLVKDRQAPGAPRQEPQPASRT
jgi:transposase